MPKQMSSRQVGGNQATTDKPLVGAAAHAAAVKENVNAKPAQGYSSEKGKDGKNMPSKEKVASDTKKDVAAKPAKGVNQGKTSTSGTPNATAAKSATGIDAGKGSARPKFGKKA